MYNTTVSVRKIYAFSVGITAILINTQRVLKCLPLVLPKASISFVKCHFSVFSFCISDIIFSHVYKQQYLLLLCSGLFIVCTVSTTLIFIPRCSFKTHVYVTCYFCFGILQLRMLTLMLINHIPYMLCKTRISVFSMRTV